jgi:O-antigen/teichoic acid export membrane protein
LAPNYGCYCVNLSSGGKSLKEAGGVAVAKNAGVTIGQSVIVNATNILLFVGAAWYLPSIADLGIYSTLIMIATLFYVIMGFALPRANVRFIARYIGQNRINDAAGVARLILRFGFLTSIISGAIVWVFADFLSLILFQMSDYSWLFQALVPYVFLLTFQQFIQSALGGLQKFKTIAKIQITQSAVLGILGAFLLIQGWGILGIIIGWTVGYFTGDTANLIAFHSVFKGAHGKHEVRPLVSFSGPLYGMDILSYLVQNIDKFLVLFIAGTALLGIYSPVVTIATLVGIIGTSLNAVLLPKLSEIEGQSGQSGLSIAALESSRWVFVVCTPVSIGLALIATPLMLIFGDRLLPSIPALVILTVAMALTSGQIVVNGVLLSLGRTRVFLAAAFIGMLMDIAISMLLIDPLGAAGAALGKVGLQFCLFLVPLAFMAIKTDLHLDYKSFTTTLLSAAMMGVPLLLIQVFTVDVLILPVLISIGALTYFVMLRLTRTLKSEDIILMRKILPDSLSWVVSIMEKLVHQDSTELILQDQYK